MIRILFIILAVVAAILALLMNEPLLYALAGAFLLAAVVLIIAGLRRRHKRHRKAQEGHARPERPAAPPADEELSSLGILEIRPKGQTRPAPPAAPEAEEKAAPAKMRPIAEREPVEKPAPGPETNGVRHVPAASRVSVKEKSPSVQAVDTETEHTYAGIVGPYLQALRAALDAQTVCLLRQEALALQYHIEAIVSQNAYARSGGDFTTTVPLLNASEARRAVTVRRVSEHGMPQSNLGYYRDTISVRQIAMAPVLRPGDPTIHFLLADTMQEGALGTPHRRTLLAEFARLLGTIMDLPAQEELPDETEQVRPRRDIIAEEMEKARAHNRPLALALVYLNDAETRADEGQEAVSAAEEALESHLRKTMRQGRVERFGELTYGIFSNTHSGDVESWAMQLQSELAHTTGPLEGGISIGIAMLQDRHRDPDTFRADATAALSEAYETGTCTILE